jgi:hypothetical protein
MTDYTNKFEAVQDSAETEEAIHDHKAANWKDESHETNYIWNNAYILKKLMYTTF